MKTAVMIVVLFLSGIASYGQVGPVFNYTHPSLETLKAYALEESPRGLAYRQYLVEVINAGLRDTTLRISLSNVKDVFNYLHYEEIYLEEGMYMNSGYDPSLRKMKASLGHLWTGFGWVFRIGTFSLPSIKEDCGNILKVAPMRRIINYLADQTPISPPTDFREPKKDDWVFQNPTVVREVKLNLPTQPDLIVKKDHKALWIVAGVLATSAAIYFITRDHGHPAPAPSYPVGGPAPAPSFPADTNGPGGTGGYGFVPDFNFNQQFVGEYQKNLGLTVNIHF